MKKISNTLLENAISSIKEALRKYDEAEHNNRNDYYKFSIIYFVHFFELAFKYAIVKINPLLIYRKPFEDLATNSKKEQPPLTINISQAAQILINSGVELKTLMPKLEALEKLRNKIIHHQYSFDRRKTDHDIGRLISIYNEIEEKYQLVDLAVHLNKEQQDIFDKIKTKYYKKLRIAQDKLNDYKQKAYEGRDYKEQFEDVFPIYECSDCQQYLMVATKKTGKYECLFCGNTDSDNIEVECSICGVPSPKWQMSYYQNEEGEEHFECQHHYK